MKQLFAALAILAIANCATTSVNAQTYKPDFATKVVLAGNQVDILNTVTLLSPAQAGPISLTLPIGNAAGNGYILTSTTGGVLSWTNPATGVVLAGDVTGNAGANTVAKINGALLGSTTATSGNLLIGQGVGTGWVSTAVTGDVTILNTGVTAIGTNKVTNAQFRQSAALSVVGNSTNATANVADITASADGQVLRRSGTTLGFGTIATTGLTAGGTNTFLTTDGSSTVGWTGLNINSTNLSGNGIGTALNVVTGTITVPSIFSTTGTGNAVGGSYAVSLASEAANTVFSAPNGSAGTPTFRTLVLADLPGSGAITVNGSTGLSVTGSPVSLGGTLTLTNTGVTSNVAGSGISVSGATGAVTISNTGVLSAIGTTNQINVSGATGNVTFSLPQDINSGASPTFTGLTLSSLTAQPGVVHNSGAGVLSSGPVALGTEVSGQLLPTNGGTGVNNNNANTITLGGPVLTANSFTTSGNFALTLTTTGATNVTLPTTGTLLTSGGGLTTNGVVYATSGTAITSTAAGTNGQVLTAVTGGAPVWATPGSTVTLNSNSNSVTNVTNNSTLTITGSQSIYYLSSAGAVNLPGMSGGTDGRLIILVNNGSNGITITDKDVAAAAVTNEFHLQGGASVILGPDGTATLIYDAVASNSTGTTGAWRVISNY